MMHPFKSWEFRKIACQKLHYEYQFKFSASYKRFETACTFAET